MNKPIVSIIIPVYNDQQYLEQCLTSVTMQTLQDIEIICIDDASQDNSPSILNRFSLTDKRIRTYYFSEQKSALVARKQGVKMATGKYIMFLDADDYLELNACEIVVGKIISTNVEILHFTSEIENYGAASEERIKMNEKLLLPYDKCLHNESIFESCFVRKLFGFTLWNKVFMASLCKKAFEYMEDIYLPKAQDLYSFFIISFFAKSYMGWNCKPCYHYCFGRGVTGTPQITINTFERYCLQADVTKALNRFLYSQNAINDYKFITDELNSKWIDECVSLWVGKVNEKDAYLAFTLLVKHWKETAVITSFTNKYWYSRNTIAKKLKDMPTISLKEKYVKTIAFYYYHFTIGGIQKVISILIPLFQGMGYRVLLITDKPVSEQDISILPGVDRITICDYQQTDRNNYSIRLEEWNRIIKCYSIDVVLYNAWTSPLLLWDILVLKLNQVPVLVQTHSIFSYALIDHKKEFATLPSIMALADGVIVLSKADLMFWNCFNSNVHHIPNPIEPTLMNRYPTTGEKDAIVWIGRFSNEKQPWEAISIMEHVVQQIPKAALYMIGDSPDPCVLEKYKSIIEKKNLNKNIFLLGYQKDVFKHFENVKINLVTSLYEGFAMVLLEAQAHGIPTVMYEMPYLDLAKAEYGVISVSPQNRIQAALEIINLMKNDNVWGKESKLAYSGFSHYLKYDYKAAWKNVLVGTSNTDSVNPSVKIMIDTIINHYFIGWERMNRNIRKTKWIPDIWIIKKIYGGILCLQEHGMHYTLRRIKEKLIALIMRG